MFIDRLSAGMPASSRPFRSPAAAQFWFEWRRSGALLPLIAGTLLLMVIGPLAVFLPPEPDLTLRIVAATLALPILLALPVGKGFSKPDFWSGDMSLPPFLGVRPLATDDLVMIEVKVAAISASVTWFVVLVFLAIWIPLLADHDVLVRTWSRLAEIYGSTYSCYIIVGLAVLAGLFLTFRFLIDGFWIGLSGNRKLYASSAIPYAVLPVFGFIGLVVIARSEPSSVAWIMRNRDAVISNLFWIAATAGIAKFGLAVFAWRRIQPKQCWRYAPVWAFGTSCFVALSLLVWAGVWPLLPPGVDRLRDLLVLVALSIMPLARLGLAPLALSRNRHR
jgi:hypothetical protein